MAVTVSAMFIPVHDPDAALAFYRDALASRYVPMSRPGGFRWVTVGAPGQNVDIVLPQPHGGRSQAEGDALLALVTQGRCRLRSSAPTTSTPPLRRFGRRAPRYSRSQRLNPGE
jgi:catechol 2,3-dioxygenase-like lactoylglutathione lyase family enzyme